MSEKINNLRWLVGDLKVAPLFAKAMHAEQVMDCLLVVLEEQAGRIEQLETRFNYQAIGGK